MSTANKSLLPRFALGRILATPGALEALEEAGQEWFVFLAQRAVGDWGDLDPHDWQENEAALERGGRLFSAYNLATGQRLWICHSIAVTAVLAGCVPVRVGPDGACGPGHHLPHVAIQDFTPISKT